MGFTLFTAPLMISFSLLNVKLLSLLALSLFSAILNPQGFSFCCLRCTSVGEYRLSEGSKHTSHPVLLFSKDSWLLLQYFSRPGHVVECSQGFWQSCYSDFGSFPFCGSFVSGLPSKFAGSLLTTLNLVCYHLEPIRLQCWDFPGDAVVKNPPANAGDTGSIPGPGRSHMLWSS